MKHVVLLLSLSLVSPALVLAADAATAKKPEAAAKTADKPAVASAKAAMSTEDEYKAIYKQKCADWAKYNKIGKEGMDAWMSECMDDMKSIMPVD